MICRSRYRPIEITALIASILLLASCTSLLRPQFTSQPVALQQGQYQLDPEHASLHFKVSHFGFSQYVGRFNMLQATLDYDPANMQATRLQAIVDTASIDVNNPEFASELAGPAWLDSAAHPQAVLTLEGVDKHEGAQSWHTATLTLRGRQAPVRLRVKFNGGAKNRLTGRYTIGFEASAKLKRSDFGIKKYLGLVGDEVELEIHAEFQKVGNRQDAGAVK